MPSFSSPRLRLPAFQAFTLLEVLVTLAVLFVILVAVLQFFDDVDRAWKSSGSDPFAEAQDAFETVVRNLASATLAPYLDYADANGNFRTSANFVPDHLARRSDLDFVCGPAAGAAGLLAASNIVTNGSGVFFLAPQGDTQTYAHTGLQRLLNAMGYFVAFGDDETTPGFIQPLSHRWRWRLKQVLQPAESLQIFALTPPGTWPSSAWIQPLVPPAASVPVLAENVVTLLVLPLRTASDSGPPLAPAFSYDTRDTTNKLTLHQLPPRLFVALVAIDSNSADRLAALDGSNAPLLVSTVFFQHGNPTNTAVQVTQLNADLSALDATLTTQKIGHRIFQREILLPSSSWSNTPSP
jgi:uncharacterized protein (TIGR02599 family)